MDNLKNIIDFDVYHSTTSSENIVFVTLSFKKQPIARVIITAYPDATIPFAHIRRITKYNFSKFLTLDANGIKKIVKEFILDGGLNAEISKVFM